MAHQDDARLALAVHRGDQKAVDRLVLTYQDAIFGYAVRLLRHHFDAQEVTQDTFIRAYHALRKYSTDHCEELALRPWLFRIARNLALNRRRSRRRTREADTPTEEVTTHETVAMQPMEANETMAHLQHALGRLSRESRELIVLRFIEDMSYAEIVAVVGTTESAVRGKVFRALRALRKILNEQEDDHGVQGSAC